MGLFSKKAQSFFPFAKKNNKVSSQLILCGFLAILGTKYDLNHINQTKINL
ncbi:hypothetical protein HMPREF1872_01116 [Amygdalobacter nucleatus]|uniref:Uncharacterized protein n=1 Tax=Amygdalobacter nucleatus TaxID=3029274 RepID=A0A133Y909_9FIRM|nr:hypothetical protein HMPREF1872_01116 [Amygdalobacter nucleatus]